jgi:hypothetical protein
VAVSLLPAVWELAAARWGRKPQPAPSLPPDR